MNKPIGPTNIRYKPPSIIPDILLILLLALVFAGVSTCEVNTYKNKEECMGVLISRMIEKGQPMQDITFDKIKEECRRYDR